MRSVPYAAAAATVVFLLWACGACFAIEHRCIHDELQRKFGFQPVVARFVSPSDPGREVAYEAVDGYELIRIKVYTNDLEDSSRFCTAAGGTSPDFLKNERVCKKHDVFTPAKKSVLVDELIPAAIKLHSDRLSVVPLTGNMVLSKSSIASTNCHSFSVPPEHFTTGATGGDMHIYVAAGPTPTGAVAWASTCALTSHSGRPVAGCMNFSPHYISTAPQVIRAATHELAHALGFSYDRFSSLTTAVTIRGKSTRVVSSNKTLQATRDYYNCPTATGMELEDEGGSGTALSHWERRNAKDELMAGVIGIGYYTALTLSLFQDLGYYRANFDLAEEMQWGSGAGCGLLNNKCVINGTSSFPDMFCAASSTSSNVLSCTSDRYGLGTCSTVVYTADLPPQFQYFTNPKYGGRQSELTDFCPIVTPFSNTGCTNGDIYDMPGSVIGPASRCMKGNGLRAGSETVGDICVLVSCNHGFVSIRYAGNPNFFPCPEGTSIVPTAGSRLTSGRIICPSYAEVCTIQPPDSLGGVDGATTASTVFSLALAAFALLLF